MSNTTNQPFMVEKLEWVFFKEIIWNCPENNRFNVDTRDFHVGYRWENKPHPDFETIKKYPHFFLTETELKELLERYFTESGGVKKWRFFNLMDPRTKKGTHNGWGLKYLRIFRTELGFIVCDSDKKAIKKEILNFKGFHCGA